jgi:putative holliday junction resolvase
VTGEKGAYMRTPFVLPSHFLLLTSYLPRMIPEKGRIISVDWGEVRIGLALSDESQILATPLETLCRRQGKRFPMPRFLELTAIHQPVGILVGLPLSSEGTEGESAEAAREVAAILAKRTSLPLALWDERMSTARALGAIREQGGSTRGRKADVDALAAAVLLQHFLDARSKGTGKTERTEKTDMSEETE